MDEAQLAQEYRSRILYFVLKHVRDRSAAEEIAQDALLITIQAWREKRILDDSTPGSYVFGVAKNLILKYQSRQMREGYAAAKPDPSSIPWMTHPEAELLLKERQREMQNALDQLSNQDREILYHAFVEADGLEEISRKLGIPYVAARKRKSRAVDRLRKIFMKLSQKKGA